MSKRMQSAINANQTAAQAERLQRSEETLLVLAARMGDPRAFERLLARFEKPLLYYLRRFIAQPEAALDVHQEVWLDAYRNLPKLVTPEAFRAWLYRIAHDKAARYVRHAVTAEDRTTSLAVENQDIPMEEEVQAAGAEAVHRALDQLSVPFREVLTLHYLKDLTLEEMTAVLGCPLGTVKSRLFHARAAIRQTLERNGYARNP